MFLISEAKLNSSFSSIPLKFNHRKLSTFAVSLMGFLPNNNNNFMDLQRLIDVPHDMYISNNSKLNFGKGKNFK